MLFRSGGTRYRFRIEKRDHWLKGILGARIRVEEADENGWPVYRRYGGNRPRFFKPDGFAATFRAGLGS